MHGKYYIRKNGMPTLISEAELHKDNVNRNEVESAGYWDYINGQFRCYGESISLGLKSRLEDSDILTIFFK